MKKKNLALTAMLLTLIGVFVFGYIFVPQRSFSDNENRSLQTFPQITLKSVLSGETQSKLTTYASDQILFRDELISVKTVLQKAVGRRDIGGVYLCDDGYYIEKTTKDDIDDKVYSDNLQSLKTFCDFYKGKISGEITVGIIPDAAEVLHDKLPANAATFDQREVLNTVAKTSGVKNIDFLTALTDVKEDAFFKTDHHWTAKGAYSAYKAYCKTVNIPAAEDFETETVATDFYGTLYSKVIDPSAQPDTIEFYRFDGDENYKVTADGKERDGIYDRTFLEKKDKYSAFLGGNRALVTVSGGKGNGNLLVIRDSYTASLLPLLMRNYESVTLVDTRYYKNSLKDVVQNNNITDISVILSAKNFATDSSFGIVNY